MKVRRYELATVGLTARLWCYLRDDRRLQVGAAVVLRELPQRPFIVMTREDAVRLDLRQEDAWAIASIRPRRRR